MNKIWRKIGQRLRSPSYWASLFTRVFASAIAGLLVWIITEALKKM